MGYAPTTSIDVGPDPADSGTTLSVTPDSGDRFPKPPFTYLIFTPQTVPRIGVDAEEGTVLTIDGDHFTLERGAQPVSVDTGKLIAAVSTMTLYDLDQLVELEYDALGATTVVFQVRTPSGYDEQHDGGAGPNFSVSFPGSVSGLWHWRPLVDDVPGVEHPFYVRFSDVV